MKNCRVCGTGIHQDQLQKGWKECSSICAKRWKRFVKILEEQSRCESVTEIKSPERFLPLMNSNTLGPVGPENAWVADAVERFRREVLDDQDEGRFGRALGGDLKLEQQSLEELKRLRVKYVIAGVTPADCAWITEEIHAVEAKIQRLKDYKKEI